MDYLIHHFLCRQADARTDEEALVDGVRRWTYGELWGQVQAIAGALAQLGVDRLDRVGVQLPTCTEQVVVLLAASASSAVSVPIHISLLPHQVAHIARDCQLRVLVTTEHHWARLESELTDGTDIAHVILVDEGERTLRHDEQQSRPRVHSYQALVRADFPLPKQLGIDRDLAAILYTSGSTGLPKGVMLSHANLVAGAAIVSDYLSISERDRILAALPFSFDAGLNQLTTAFQQGATLVLVKFLMAKQVVTLLQGERITALAGVPTFWNLLVQSRSFLTSQFPDLRYITNTGGALSSATLEVLSRVLSGTDIVLMYGLTEAFRSTYLPPDQLHSRPGAMGRAIPNTEIFVLDADGRRCRPGEVGELVHHGPTVALGYWNRPELTAEVFRPHPFPAPGGAAPPTVCFSGDLVREDDEGYFYFVARRDNQIKTAGFRVSPTEIEDVLYQHTSVAQAAVVGTPDAMLGEAIVAFVTGRSGHQVAADELLAFTAQRLPSHMVPKQIIELAALPTTTSGKIDYARLRSFVAKALTPDSLERFARD